MDSKKFQASKHKDKVEAAVRACEALRSDGLDAVDISLNEFLTANYQLTLEALYADLGINPNSDTIRNLFNMPDSSLRWLIPELYRDAIRLGLRKTAIHTRMITAEQNVSQTSVKMPAINMSDAAPRRVGVGETITLGSVSFDQKDVKIYKLGRGIKVPDEVVQYVALNLVGIFVQDFGVKLGMGLDALAISTAMNGDQADGSDSVATVGIATANTLVYKDLLKIWVRMSRLGKNPTLMIAGEDMSIDILDLLTTTRVFGTQRSKVDLKTPIPQTSDMYVHGNITANKVLIMDTSDAMIKLNAQPLKVESERIISNQTQETYVSLTTGFANIFRDSRLVMDKSLAYSGNSFPSWMDPSAQENVVFQ